MAYKGIIFRLLLIASVLMAGVGVIKAEDKKGEIKFSEKIHDFGTINEKGGPVSYEFEFTNTGTGNLLIVDANASCGCTSPAYPKQPIAPGKKGKITVTYNPLGRPGGFEKMITVRTDGKPRKVILKIRGSVMPKQ